MASGWTSGTPGGAASNASFGREPSAGPDVQPASRTAWTSSGVRRVTCCQVQMREESIDSRRGT
ncbi:hypothetical protein ACWGB8_20975 [Kitasatospora sp. NPDC054939]